MINKILKRKKMHEIKIAKDKNENTLKIGDKVKNQNGVIGRLVNLGGKSWVEFEDRKVLLNEVDTKTLEKVA